MGAAQGNGGPNPGMDNKNQRRDREEVGQHRPTRIAIANGIGHQASF
jgi:hypothetical protein